MKTKLFSRQMTMTVVLLLSSVNFSFAQSFTADKLNYRITSTTSKTVSVEGMSESISGNLSIPRSVEYNNVTYSVTAIASSAFTSTNMSGIKSLYINMLNIPNKAFQNLSFRTVTIGPDVKTIGTECFGTIYKTIWLPNVVPSGTPLRAKGYINYCSSNNYLESSSFSSYVSSFIKYSSLSDKFNVNGITYVKLDNNVECDVIDCDYSSSPITVNIGSSVTFQNQTFSVRNINDYACSDDDRIVGDIILANNGFIGYGAFLSCSNASGNIVVSCQGDVGMNAFKDCSKISGNISVSNVGNIGWSAFENCSNAIAGDIRNQGNIKPKAFYSCSGFKSLTVSNNGYIDGQAFYKCTGLQSLEISNSVSEIKRDAFKESKITENATINNNGHIRGQAFASVKGNFVALINNKGTLADSAFYQCQMKSLTIGSNVTNVGKYCFHKGSISDFAIIENSGELEIQAFSNITGGFVADIRNSGALPEHCFSSSTMNDVTIGNSVTSLGSYCFSSSTMNDVTIGNSVTSLGSYCFSSSTMNNVTIGNSVTSLGSYCFSSSTMKNVTIGSKVNIMNNYCFRGAKGFTSLIIPDNVLTLGTYCFQNCTTMQNITLSRGLTEIPEGTFSGCSNLLRLDVCKEINTIGNYSFNNCSNLKEVIFENKDNNYTYNLGYGGTSSSKIPLFNTCCLDTVYVGGKLAYDKNSPTYSPFRGNTTLRSIRFADDKETKIYAREFENCTNLQNVWMNNVMDDIGDYAFKGCTSLQHFVVGPAVSQLGANSFASCSQLADIDLSNVVTIKNNSFESCRSLLQISIPQSTTEIGNQTFKNCTSLKRLFIEERTTNLFLGKNASNSNYKGIQGAGEPLFANCPLDSVYIGGPISYDKTLADGYSPFYFNESLRSVYITNRERNVYKYEFHNCLGLKRVKLGDGVRNIQEYAFQGCTGLTYFEFASTLQNIGEEAFSDCSNITKIISHASAPPVVGEQGLQDISKWNCVLYVPEGSVEEYREADQWSSFYNINEIITVKNITLSQNSLTLTTIGQSATLTATLTPLNPMNGDITWSSSDQGVAVVSSTGVVTAVANGTAVITATTCDGTNLSATCSVTVYIPPRVIFADANVKALCVQNWDTNQDGEIDMLEAAAVTDLGEVFRSNDEIISFDELQYFTGLTSIGESAFNSCENLTSIVIPEGVTSIGNYAFNNCHKMTSIDIPEGVTSIGDNAFSSCAGLTSITLPHGLLDIGKRAFYWCINLTSITIPSSVTSIGEKAFSVTENLGVDCKLTSIVVEEGNPIYDSRNGCNAIILTKFNWLYYGCNNTVIPEGVRYINSKAFENCKDLTTMFIPKSVVSIKEGAFDFCSQLTSFNVDNSNSKYSSENGVLFDKNKEKIVLYPEGKTESSYIIPSSVTSIGDWAFKHCSGLTSVTIPSSVTSIGCYAFSGCSNLTNVKVEWETPLQIEDYFFPDSKKATLYVPAGSKSAYEEADYWKDFKDIIEMEAPSIIGDLSGDGKVSITDIVMIIDVIAGDITDANQVAAADVNGDGNVSITDCVAAIDLIAAQSSSPNSVKRKVHAQISETDFISASMQDNLLTVSLDNERRYTAFQMVVNMPEGMTLSRGSMDKLRGEDHLLTVRNLGGGQYLVVGFSSDNEELTGTSGRLLSLNTEGQADADIVISDIEFATTQAEACCLSNITISSVPTGVEFVASPIQQSNVIYDLQGRRVTKATKGIYIYNGKKTIIK